MPLEAIIVSAFVIVVFVAVAAAIAYGQRQTELALRSHKTSRQPNAAPTQARAMNIRLLETR
jgi:hypothetical protein